MASRVAPKLIRIGSSSSLWSRVKNIESTTSSCVRLHSGNALKERNIHEGVVRTQAASSPSSVCVTTNQSSVVSRPIHSSAKSPSEAIQGPFYAPPSSSSSFPQQTAPVGVSPPQMEQLRTLFVSAAVPMVGFGFMDNFIMIQAGGYIDATLGVKLGLATMTAAAIGQIVSDVSGVMFGGALERSLQRFGVVTPSNLTPAQLRLPICRNVSMAGAVLGVMLGCILGASSLFWIDSDSVERQKLASELQSSLKDMLSEDGGLSSLECESCTLYECAHVNGTQQAPVPLVQIVDDETEAESDSRISSIVKTCANQASIVVDNELVDVNGNHRPALCAPVLNSSKKVMGVLEFRRKKLRGDVPNSGSNETFKESDEVLARMAAHHVGVFLRQIYE